MAVVKILCTPVVAPHRVRTAYGVGEELDLSCEIRPATQAATVGNITFSVYSGGGTISLANSVARTARFTAGDLAASVKLVAKNAANVEVARKTLIVKAPDDVRMTSATLNNPAPGQAGAGFIATAIKLSPRNYCFEGIEVREGKCLAIASGYWAASSGQVHPPGPWATVQNFNQVNLTDDIHSDNPAPPYSKGTFEWPIPWEYRVNHGTAHQIAIVLHKEECNVLGHVTIWKGGMRAQRSRHV